MKTSLYSSTARWIMPGLIAGLVFLAIVLVSGAYSTTLWAMPEGIARTVGVNAPVGYSFAFVPVFVGIVTHLVLSIVLGILFTAIVLKMRLHGWMLVVAAVVFVSVETAFALWGVLHVIESSATFSYFLSSVPWWASVIGHYAYALVLGLLLMVGPYAVNREKPQLQVV